jgi:hypothetical protein
VAILQASLVAAGGTRGLAWVQDFTATGTVTYFGGQQVSGAATLKVRVPDQYRLDSNLPQGTRSHAVTHGRGVFKEVTGHVSQVPGDYAIHRAIATFPYPGVARVLTDPAAFVSYVGLVTIGGRQANQVRVQRRYPTIPNVPFKLLTTDYFVDTQTNLIVKRSDSTYPSTPFSGPDPQDFELLNYVNVNGINMSMTVRHKVDSQTLWELNLTSVTFNTGLSDIDFVVQ